MIFFSFNNCLIDFNAGNREFYGYIYGPDATVHLGSNAVVNGSIIGELFTASGNPSVLHIPLTRTPEGYEEYTSGSSRYRKGYWE